MTNRKSIQILRTSENGINNDNKDTILLDGQPLYNKQKNYLTIGNIGDNNKTVARKPITVREVIGYVGDSENIGGSFSNEYCLKYDAGSLNLQSPNNAKIKAINKVSVIGNDGVSIQDNSDTYRKNWVDVNTNNISIHSDSGVSIGCGSGGLNVDSKSTETSGQTVFDSDSSAGFKFNKQVEFSSIISTAKDHVKIFNTTGGDAGGQIELRNNDTQDKTSSLYLNGGLNPLMIVRDNTGSKNIVQIGGQLNGNDCGIYCKRPIEVYQKGTENRAVVITNETGETKPEDRIMGGYIYLHPAADTTNNLPTIELYSHSSTILSRAATDGSTNHTDLTPSYINITADGTEVLKLGNDGRIRAKQFYVDSKNYFVQKAADEKIGVMSGVSTDGRIQGSSLRIADDVSSKNPLSFLSASASGIDYKSGVHSFSVDNTGSVTATGIIRTKSIAENAVDASQGTVKAQNFNAVSDKRLKENIEEYKPEKSVLDLPVYTFNFKSDENKKTRIGCLAQDLQEICPEIVHEDDKGYLSIEENKIVYLLLEEVKKLKERVDELEKR